ncbi:hypothetical protein [Streptomyces boncukensis]|uniref:hypothetical protein n=1 Tax=Streptomyces boncukensis TaxID=2711219 RepID=UPI0030B9E4DD
MVAGLALAGLAALTAGGCGGSDDGDGSGKAAASSSAQPSDSGRPSDSGELSESPADRSTPPRSPAESSAESPVSAADGRDVGACADGDCEIAVPRPVTFRFKGPSGPAKLSVTEVGPNEVEYEVTSDGGRAKGGAGGPGRGCITVLRSGGTSNSCGRVATTRPSPQPDAAVIQVATGKDGTALLHIVSS